MIGNWQETKLPKQKYKILILNFQIQWEENHHLQDTDIMQPQLPLLLLLLQALLIDKEFKHLYMMNIIHLEIDNKLNIKIIMNHILNLLIEIHLMLQLENTTLFTILGNQLLKESKDKEELLDKLLQPDKLKLIKEIELILMLKHINQEQHQEDLLELKLTKNHFHIMKDLKLLEDSIH